MWRVDLLAENGAVQTQGGQQVRVHFADAGRHTNARVVVVILIAIVILLITLALTLRPAAAAWPTPHIQPVCMAGKLIQPFSAAARSRYLRNGATEPRYGVCPKAGGR